MQQFLTLQIYAMHRFNYTCLTKGTKSLHSKYRLKPGAPFQYKDILFNHMNSHYKYIKQLWIHLIFIMGSLIQRYLNIEMAPERSCGHCTLEGIDYPNWHVTSQDTFHFQILTLPSHDRTSLVEQLPTKFLITHYRQTSNISQPNPKI